jgi:molybdopterin molybdotransferase
LTVGEALARVCEAAPVLGPERVPLAAALGRVAAEDVCSTRAVPSAPNSAMDGYAVRHADLAGLPARLRVAAVEPAGVVVEAPLAPGTAVKLFTGSVVPAGADTVVRIEDTAEEDGAVVVRLAPPRGADIRAAGEDIRALLAQALGADVVLSSGGVSVGDLDFVKGALAALGVEQLFWKVAQKPGKPLAFGRLGARLVFGLPGNPVSALVCFYLYVRPALRRLQGHRRLHLPVVEATLAGSVRKAVGLTEFVRVRLADGATGPVATAVASQSSGVLSAMGAGAGLLVGPPELGELAGGARYPVIVLGEDALARETPPF